jgi:lantibiotic leader peptide-processing serine protease
MKASAAIVVLATALLMTSAGSAATSAASGRSLYTVAFNDSSLPSNVDALVASAGGTIVARLPEIGGIAVSSATPDFQSKMSAFASVADASLSAKTSLKESFPASTGAPARTGGGQAHGAGADPQTEPDPLGGQQWDKMRMNVSSSGSYAIEQGRHDVKVALTDTGVDLTHPDIAPNFDLLESQNFITFSQDLPLQVSGDDTLQDFNGHGTWTASAVAAPINGIGISGVAPNVSIVELKTNDAFGNGNLFDWDRAVVYAGRNHFDVLSSSIYTFVQVCSNGARKHGCDDTDLILAQRAVDFARQRGVTIVGATGNENIDLSDQHGVGAPFGVQAATEVPAGLDGVVGVDATGYFNEKAFYASYGKGVVDVTAPGGDSVTQPAPAPYLNGGRLIGAWSSTALPSTQTAHEVQSCLGAVCGYYSWDQGTSMATPNVAGVAALIVSRYGSFDPGTTTHLRPELVESILEGTAAAQSCPDPHHVTYPFPPEGFFAADTAVCQGGTRDNGFFGSGIADAVSALTAGLHR